MKRVLIIGMALAVAASAGSAWAWGTTATTTSTMRTLETQLEGTATSVGVEAARLGDLAFTERFANEFGVTTDRLTQQMTQYDADWSDLFLAYSIASAARTKVSIDQILTLRASGRTWIQIARTLRIPPGRLWMAVESRAETFTLVTTTTRTTTEDRSGSGTTSDRSASNRTADRSGSSRVQGSGSTRAASRGVAAVKGIDRQIDSRLQLLEDQSARLGDATIAERLARELDVTADVLNQQRTQYGADWGDLLMAYTIVDRSKTTVTVDEIFALRASGQSWTQIARSLRIPPGQLLRAIRAETRSLTDATLARGGSARGGSKATTKGIGATMRSTRGASATALNKVSKTTNLMRGQGAVMRAAARGAMTTHGKK